MSGRSWLFQLATGDDAANIPESSFRTPASRTSASRPSPRNQLSSVLRTAQVTLPVPLTFRSDRAGSLAITFKTLSAHYVARPLAEDPLTLRLRGSWTALRLSAPAGRKPFASSARVTAKLLGRELNEGSGVPPLAPPSTGVRIRSDVWVATVLPFAPVDPGGAGLPLPLVSARVYLEALADAEAVLEIRPDVAGVPGPPATAPVVRRIAAGGADWVEFDLAQPLPVIAGGAPVWIALRANQGELIWFTNGPGEVRLSVDKGQKWGTMGTELATPAAPLAQLFHAVADPLPPPAIRAQIGDRVVMENLPLARVGESGREFASQALALDARVLAGLEAAAGNARASTDLMLFSRSAMDLTVAAMSLSYDPFGSSAQGSI